MNADYGKGFKTTLKPSQHVRRLAGKACMDLTRDPINAGPG